MAAMDDDRVYLLYDGIYSDRELWGVYATLELAQADHITKPRHPAKWKLMNEDRNGYPLEERRWACWFYPGPATSCDLEIEERALRRFANAEAATA